MNESTPTGHYGAMFGLKQWNNQVRRNEKVHSPRKISYDGPPVDFNYPSTVANRAPFLTVKSGPKQVTVYAGILSHNNLPVFNSVAQKIIDNPANGDFVWVQRAAANDWAIASGASYPTDKLYKELSTITTNGSGNITAIVNQWQGGDIDWAETFPVSVTGTGNPPVYDVAALGGCIILTVASPVNYRDTNLDYSAGIEGVAWFRFDGEFDFFVFDEHPTTEAC